MTELASNSVALMVTSPPYHVGKDYDTDASFDEYMAMLSRVFAEVLRVLEPGGRAVVNVANLGRRPYLPLSHLVTRRMLDLGFLMRAEIIWQKARGANGNCAWGSWRSASNPVVRDVHEYCMVFSKGDFRRSRRGASTITAEEFMASTLSVWEMQPESARRVGHPAPFPVELLGGSSSCTPTKVIWCSIPSSEAGQPQLPPCSPAATTWGMRSTPGTSRWRGSGSRRRSDLTSPPAGGAAFSGPNQGSGQSPDTRWWPVAWWRAATAGASHAGPRRCTRPLPTRARVASGASPGIRRLTMPERSLSDCHGARTSAPALRPDSSTAAERSSTASEIMSIPTRSKISSAAVIAGCRGKRRCAHLITEGGGVDRLWDREFESQRARLPPANHSASAGAVPSP